MKQSNLLKSQCCTNNMVGSCIAAKQLNTKKSNAAPVVQLFWSNSANIFDNWILSYFPPFSPLSSESPQLAVSEETQQRIKNQSSLFLGKSCNYVTNPLEEVSRTDYAFLPEGGGEGGHRC